MTGDSLTSLTKEMTILESSVMTFSAMKMTRKSSLIISLTKRMNWISMMNWISLPTTLSSMRFKLGSLQRCQMPKKKILGDLVPSLSDAF